MKFFVRSKAERERVRQRVLDATASLAECTELVCGAIEVVAERERRIAWLAARMRAERDALLEARAVADESERLLGRAAGELVAACAEAKPQTEAEIRIAREEEAKVA